MSETSNFDFCPKCGALAKDGICQSCGYQNPDAARLPVGGERQPDVWEQNAQAGNEQNRPGQNGPESNTDGCKSGNIQPENGAAYNQEQPGSQYSYGQPQQQIQGMYGQPQVNAYQNYGSSNMYPNYMPAPAPVKKSSSAPFIVLLVLLSVLLIFGIAFAVFYVCGNSENPFEDYKWSIPRESIVSGEKPSRGEPEASVSEPGGSGHEPESSEAGSSGGRYEKDEEGLDSGKYYTEIYSDIRYDLDYQVEMNYEVFQPEDYEDYPYAYVDVSYPQIAGDVPNIDYLNEVLEYEYAYFVDYFEENLRDLMEDESYYYCLSEAFVTYMDEKVMSVVFKEQVQLDAYGLINLYCLNINMEDGVIMNNTELLDINTEFAIDFRNREILENGDELLTNYSDQEILTMLQDPDYLIIFYTPMGMEVGLNMMDVIIYVTYSDYERFKSGF